MNCSIYGARGEAVAGYIKKGMQIGVSGEGLLRTWDAKDGSKGSSLECRVNDVTLLGKKDSESVSPQRQDAPSNDKKYEGEIEDIESDIPF